MIGTFWSASGCAPRRSERYDPPVDESGDLVVLAVAPLKTWGQRFVFQSQVNMGPVLFELWFT